MARTFGKLICDVWDGDEHEDFRALPSDAKVLYWAFCSQRDITPAGVVPLTERRWQRWMNVDRDAVDTALATLIEGGFVVVDEDTAEVWVRSFVKHDGRLENTNLAKSVHSSLVDIRSAAIREACYRLLGDLTGQTPSVKGLPTPFEGPSDADANEGRRDDEGTGKGPPTPRASSQHPKPRPAASSREPRPDIDDDTTAPLDLPPAAAAAIALLIDHRVANEAKRNPHGLRRSLQANVPAEVAPALLARLERCPNATTDELATKVLGLTELDLHRLRS